MQVDVVCLNELLFLLLIGLSCFFPFFLQLLGAEDVEEELSEEVVEEVAVELVQVLGADLMRTNIFFDKCEMIFIWSTIAMEPTLAYILFTLNITC